MLNPHTHVIVIHYAFSSEESTEEPTESDLLPAVIYASTGGAMVMVIVLMILMCACCIGLCRAKSEAGDIECTLVHLMLNT